MFYITQMLHNPYLDLYFPRVLQDVVHDYFTALDIVITYPQYEAYLKQRYQYLTERCGLGIHIAQLLPEPLACFLIDRQTAPVRIIIHDKYPPYVRHLLRLYNTPRNLYTTTSYDAGILDFIPYPHLFHNNYGHFLVEDLLKQAHIEAVLAVFTHHPTNINGLISLCLTYPHVDILTYLFSRHLVNPEILVVCLQKWIEEGVIPVINLTFEYFRVMNFDGECQYDVLASAIQHQPSYVNVCLIFGLYTNTCNYITLAIAHQPCLITFGRLVSYFQDDSKSITHGLNVAVEKCK